MNAVFGTKLGPQHQSGRLERETKKKKRDACFGILDKDCEVKSPKCVVIHLSHFPLPSKCLQKDSDCRVHSIPLLGDDPASPSDCANWAMQAVFAS